MWKNFIGQRLRRPVRPSFSFSREPCPLPKAADTCIRTFSHTYCALNAAERNQGPTAEVRRKAGAFCTLAVGKRKLESKRSPLYDIHFGEVVADAESQPTGRPQLSLELVALTPAIGGLKPSNNTKRARQGIGTKGDRLMSEPPPKTARLASPRSQAHTTRVRSHSVGKFLFASVHCLDAS